MKLAGRAGLLAASVVMAGCSEQAAPVAGDGGGGGHGAAAQPPDAGPESYPCAPGELELEGGGCQPAGVPPGGCGEGFAHDGDAGCAAVRPPSPGAAGRLAIPGETSCHPVAPCGAGPWDGIPVEPDTQYVDATYQGGSSDGSAAAPWTSTQQGIDAAGPGAIVAITAGSYDEHLLLAGKPARLWGKCPDEVELAPGTGDVAIYLREGADGSEVHALAVTGSSTGLLAEDTAGVLVDRLWAHDLGWIGLYLYAPGDGQTASLTLSRSLVESATSRGVYAGGSSIDIDRSVVRERIRKVNVEKAAEESEREKGA